MGNLLCMGLILQFRALPAPRHPDNADHRLPARMDVNVLNRDLPLALATVAIQRFQ
jgi:hypothetical protein